MKAGEQWATFWALIPMKDWEWSGWFSTIQWMRGMRPLLLSISLFQERPSINGPSALKTQSTMSVTWLTNLKLLSIEGNGM